MFILRIFWARLNVGQQRIHSIDTIAQSRNIIIVQKNMYFKKLLRKTWANLTRYWNPSKIKACTALFATMFKDYLNSKVINTSATIRSSSFKLNHVAIKSVLIKAWVKGTCRIYNETFLKKRSIFEHYYSGLLIRCGSLLKISSVTGKFPRKLWKGGSPSLETETGTQTSRIPPQKKTTKVYRPAIWKFRLRKLIARFFWI